MTALTSMRALVALALLANLCVPAQAQRWPPGPTGAQGFAPRTVAERRVNLAQAIAIVQRATGGKVLDAKDLGGQYRVKVLTRSGEVRVVYVDAQTGAMRD
jgi:Peptidase propeptide and YPEB domain